VSSSTPDKLAMTRREVQLMIAIEPVLKRLGLSLFCVKCQALGLPDGIRAGNDLHATELVIECGCTTRVYNRGWVHN
jgi:hypothetical protein